VGIACFIYVKAKLRERVGKLEWLQVKMGFKGSLGNKGVIVLFMTIDSSRMTIMNCHLAAG
jgi:hypothetical protein